MAKRVRSRMPWYERTATGFLIAAGVLAAAAFVVSLARVRIVITPRVERIVQDLELTLVGSGPASEHQVAGRLARVDGTAETVAGPAPEPGVSAEIRVTLVNTQAVAQPLIARTRLQSPEGVQFRMVRGATVPARGRVEVAVVYDTAFAQPTADLSTAIPRKYTIPGLSPWLRERVWGESTGAMVLLSVAEERTPAPEATLEERARADATRRTAALAQEGEEVIPLETSVQVATSGGTTRAVATTTALIVSRGAIAERAREALARSVAAGGRELVGLAEGSPTVRVVSQDPRTGRATVAVHAEGDVILRSGRQAFEPQRIAGFTAEGVRTYLRSIPGVADVEVSLWPFWVERVPMNLRSVDVEVRAP